MFYYFGAQEKVGAGADRSCFASAYAFSSSVDVCVIHLIANVCVINWGAFEFSCYRASNTNIHFLIQNTGV